MDREQHTTASPPSLSDAMEKIMAHPELISMVASVLGAPAPSTPSESAPPEKEEPTGAVTEVAAIPDAGESAKDQGGDVMASLMPLLSSLSGGKGGGKKAVDDHRACLLQALKPYVSPGRREAIDTMIRLSQISDILKHMV